ncbi:MAG: endolytic transglycosylase MltG [Chitinophagaceae bacterium]
MKRFIYSFFLLVALVGSVCLWLVYGSATAFEVKSVTILIDEEHLPKQQLIDLLKEKKVVKSSFAFEQLGNQLNIWERIKTGKFKIAKGESLINIVRMFRNNKQAEINLVINKIRLPEDLAKLIGKNFSTDSATALSILKNTNTLADYGADSSTFLFNIIPNTYSFYWSTTVEKIFEKLSVESKKFWDENNRNQKASSLGLTPLQVYIIASIVEEETNKDDEKGNVASVYINRMNKGMPLAADPTIKFALKDFTLRRILFGHLNVVSPYNTYKNKGLPPGPICTPSIKTLDAVLSAPRTDYIFFVAKADFSGYHHFSSNYAEHDQYAKLYQKALTEYLNKKKESGK